MVKEVAGNRNLLLRFLSRRGRGWVKGSRCCTGTYPKIQANLNRHMLRGPQTAVQRMSNNHGNDQRRHVRYELIDFALLESDTLADPIRCVIVDVSLGGLQIRSKCALPVGRECYLRIARLGKKPIRIRGEVRHSGVVKGADLIASGFRFLPEDQDERVEIMEYVHSVFVRRTELVAS